jgi:mycothiol synthase
MLIPFWQAELDAAEVAEVRALIDAATEADGADPVGEQALLALRPGSAAVHLLARAEGRLVGYASLTDGVAEPAVHPDSRRRGVGTALVAALLERSGSVRIWAHGEHPGALALAERFGFARARELWQLHRRLDSPPLPPAGFPDGVSLRGFVVGQDEADFLQVNNAAFGWHPEQGGWTVEQLKLREAEPWFDPDGFLLAVDGDDDRLLGFHWTKVHPGTADRPPIGEVYVLGVDPAARGRSLGRALTLAGLHHLRGRGLDAAMLYVEADNDAAVRVYRNLGFTRWHTDVLFEHRAADERR